MILFPEEDKENKIKLNCNNIIYYLKSPDLWDCDIVADVNFPKNLNELKLMNFKINQIVSLYEYLGTDIEEDFFDDVENKKNSTSIEEQEDSDSF